MDFDLLEEQYQKSKSDNKPDIDFDALESGYQKSIVDNPAEKENQSDDIWLEQNIENIPKDLKVPIEINGETVNIPASKALSLLNNKIDNLEKLGRCLGV